MSKLRGYLGLIALSAALAACGGKKEEAAAPAAEAPAAEAAAPAAAADAGATKVAADATDTLDGTKFADMKGDATHGEAVFAQCKTCHVIEAGVNRKVSRYAITQLITDTFKYDYVRINGHTDCERQSS